MGVQADEHAIRTVGGVLHVFQYGLAVSLVDEIANIGAIAALDLQRSFEDRSEIESVGTRVAHDLDCGDLAPAGRRAQHFVDAPQLRKLLIGQHVSAPPAQRIQPRPRSNPIPRNARGKLRSARRTGSDKADATIRRIKKARRSGLVQITPDPTGKQASRFRSLDGVDDALATEVAGMVICKGNKSDVEVR